MESIASAWLGFTHTISVLVHHQATIGFFLGFIVSTIIHLVIMSDNPGRIPHLVTKSLEDSYEHLNPLDPTHPDHKPLHQFKHEYHRVRFSVFGILLFILIGAVLYFL